MMGSMGVNAAIRLAAATVRRWNVNAQGNIKCASLVSRSYASTNSTDSVSSSSSAVEAEIGEQGSKSNTATHHKFGAETSRLLDLVAGAVYTDKEVVLRELIANASDACEKRRVAMLMASSSASDELGVYITTDSTENTVEVRDTGIGMNKQDVIDNLGTIARSGTRMFAMTEGGNDETSSSDRDSLIGKFGIGFYSTLMVSDRVEVRSRKDPISAEGSDIGTIDEGVLFKNEGGQDAFSVEECAGVSIGTGVKLFLKDDAREFSNSMRVSDIVKKYSSFISFPVFVDSKQVNNVNALWTRKKEEITQAEHDEFYRFINPNAFDKPMFTMHFSTDAPLSIKALLYFPTENSEARGLQRSAGGISLYSRKVCIQPIAKNLLPDWLRFVRGVVECDDLPLSLARETPQDTGLMRRVNDVLTARVIRFLKEQSKNHEEDFSKFTERFQLFIKEGILMESTGHGRKQDLAQLLRFTSTTTEGNTQTSLSDYVKRMKDEQNVIHYLFAPDSETAMHSPYIEAMKKSGEEVLFCYTAPDELCMRQLNEFEGKQLRNVELTLAEPSDSDDAGEEYANISKEEAEKACTWVKETLGNKILNVAVSKRLVESPAMLSGHMQSIDVKVLRAMGRGDSATMGMSPTAGATLEINLKHPLIISMIENHEIEEGKEIAQLVAEQILDNALAAAGLLEDTSSGVERLNKLMLRALASTKT